MGYGGALIWTGLARNIKRRFPDKKVIFIYPQSFKGLILGVKNSDLEIYQHNPDIALVISQIAWKWRKHNYQDDNFIKIDLAQKKYHYWVSDEEGRMIYNQSGHAIDIACKALAISPVELRTRLVLNRQEEEEAEKLLADFKLSQGQYICIEPNTKKTFTHNKQWPWQHWQTLIDQLQDWIKDNKLDYKIVQLGTADSPLLNNIISLTGQTTFRQLKRLIDKAKLVIVNEGGIAHLAASSETKTAVISNPSLPAKLMTYPQHINIEARDGVHNCGSKKSCEQCQELLKSISPSQVLDKLKPLL